MFIINTYIKDIETLEPLPMANVVVSESNGSAMVVNGISPIARKSDINGKIIIPIAVETAHIKVSYVGYETIVHPADDYRNDTIFLKRKTNSLNGVTVTAPKDKNYYSLDPKTSPFYIPKAIAVSIQNEMKFRRFPAVLITCIVGVSIISFIVYKIIKK